MKQKQTDNENCEVIRLRWNEKYRNNSVKHIISFNLCILLIDMLNISQWSWNNISPYNNI